MKGRDWERLAKREILPVLGDAYTVKGSLIYRRPIEHILLGVKADTVYEASRIYLESVVMPLYQPFDALAYFVPYRLDAVDLPESAQLPGEVVELFAEKAVPYLDLHSTPGRLLSDDSWKRADDAVRLEVEGYSHLLEDDVARARDTLGRAVSLSYDPDDTWAAEALERCTLIRSLIDRNLEQARAQLLRWEEHTLAALRLART